MERWAPFVVSADFSCETPPPLALRRYTDRCFFAVEEVVPASAREGGGIRGFIVDGVLIEADDVAQLRRTDQPATPAVCELKVTRPGDATQ